MSVNVNFDLLTWGDVVFIGALPSMGQKEQNEAMPALLARLDRLVEGGVSHLSVPEGMAATKDALQQICAAVAEMQKAAALGEAGGVLDAVRRILSDSE